MFFHRTNKKYVTLQFSITGGVANNNPGLSGMILASIWLALRMFGWWTWWALIPLRPTVRLIHSKPAMLHEFPWRTKISSPQRMMSAASKVGSTQSWVTNSFRKHCSGRISAVSAYPLRNSLSSFYVSGNNYIMISKSNSIKVYIHKNVPIIGE